MTPGARAESGGWLGSAAVLGAVLALWALASNLGWVSRVFLPTPQATWAALAEGFNLRGSGNGNGQLAGWTLGVLIGASARARAWLQPLLEFVRPLPASAVLPLAIAIFGLSPRMVLAVVAFGAMWPVLLATVHGLATVDGRLGEVTRCLQLSRTAFIVKIGLPHAMPDILAGMRLALTVALIVAVVGEMIASQGGLGQAILLAARAFRASELFAGIVLLGLIGFVSNALLALAEHRLLRWQRP
ncbi:MAG: ABC transporter permease [Comamonadaceae bacterium]|nr:MAG: ABC transporter permease [Comamonadaceae bacterium]